MYCSVILKVGQTPSTQAVASPATGPGPDDPKPILWNSLSMSKAFRKFSLEYRGAGSGLIAWPDTVLVKGLSKIFPENAPFIEQELSDEAMQFLKGVFKSPAWA